MYFSSRTPAYNPLSAGAGLGGKAAVSAAPGPGSWTKQQHTLITITIESNVDGSLDAKLMNR